MSLVANISNFHGYNNFFALRYNKIVNIFKLYLTENSSIIEGDCEVSLHSSSQQPPGICQMRSATAINRDRRVGFVT